MSMKRIPMSDTCTCRDLAALRDFAEAALRMKMKTLSCFIEDRAFDESAFNDLCAE